MAIDNKSEQETISKTASVETKDGSNSVEDAVPNEEEQQQPVEEETKDEAPVTESELKEVTTNDKDTITESELKEVTTNDGEDKAVEPCSCESSAPDHLEEVEQDTTSTKKRSSPLSKEGNTDNEEPPSQKIKSETEEQ
jgi:hypothetical protein